MQSEVQISEISERYNLLLEAYLRGCGTHRMELTKQSNCMRELTRIANTIKNIKELPERKETLMKELGKLTFPGKIQLPLNPNIEVSSLKLDKCRFMDSKKVTSIFEIQIFRQFPSDPFLFVRFHCGLFSIILMKMVLQNHSF